jgi:hypothetical protein
MHLHHPVEGRIDGVYDDGPTNKIVSIDFNGHAAELPDHCERGTISSRFMLKSGVPRNNIHVGQIVQVTDVSDNHPPGVLHITGIAVPGVSKG